MKRRGRGERGAGKREGSRETYDFTSGHEKFMRTPPISVIAAACRGSPLARSIPQSEVVPPISTTKIFSFPSPSLPPFTPTPPLNQKRRPTHRIRRPTTKRPNRQQRSPIRLQYRPVILGEKDGTGEGEETEGVLEGGDGETGEGEDGGV